jgi:phage-related protein
MRKPRDPQSRFTAIYYRAADGSEPVCDYLRALGPERELLLKKQIQRLNELHDGSPHLPFPYSSQVDGELRELRCHAGSEHYRILYRRSRRLVVLLHAFRKTTRSIAASDLAVAHARWSEFESGMNKTPRPGRRPIGGDAP